MGRLSGRGRWSLAVKWSRPKSHSQLLEGKSRYDKSANLYLVAKYETLERMRIIYIGTAYDRPVSDYISQPEFKEKFLISNLFRPYRSVYVMHGVITMNIGKLDQHRLNEIQFILSTAIHPQDAKHLDSYVNGISGSYLIENKGSRCNLPKTIMLGVHLNQRIVSRKSRKKMTKSSR